jgi:hypothetical protein
MLTFNAILEHEHVDLERSDSYDLKTTALLVTVLLTTSGGLPMDAWKTSGYKSVRFLR